MTKILVLCIFAIVQSNYLNYGYSSGSITKVACEKQQLTLECPDRKIRILSALYGRRSGNICPNNAVYNTNCNSSLTFSLVVAKCDGKSKCQVDSSNEIFDDPCPATYKYLEVTYNCEEKFNKGTLINELTLCEFQTGTIECPENKRIQLVEASYGRTKSEICAYSSSKQSLQCFLDPLPIRDKCFNKTTCAIAANNKILGDPCRGTLKYLQVKYKCEDSGLENISKAIACEDEIISLQCEKSQTLLIDKATYGKLDSKICPSGNSRYDSKICVSSFAKIVISSRCHGKNYCSFTASNKLFGDPCWGVLKYLEVEYKCINNPRQKLLVARAVEFKNLQIFCENSIKIHYANYGRTSKEIFNSEDYVGDVNCHAPTSFQVVDNICSDKRSCTVPASNTIFGDPCPRILKYLEVGYTCTDPDDLEPESF